MIIKINIPEHTWSTLGNLLVHFQKMVQIYLYDGV